MNERNINLLVVSDPSNMAWLTGYDGWSFYTHQCVVVPESGEPWWFGRGQDANGAKRTVYMDMEHIYGYADHYVQSTVCHPMERLSEWILEHGWNCENVGVELDNYYFSAAAYLHLVRGLPNSKLHDATGMVNWQRAVKSETEISYMKKAGEIVGAMHERIREQIQPGIRKCDLVAEIYDAGIRGVPGAGGDYTAIVPLLPSGEDASAPHLTWDDKPMQSDEGTFFEIAGCFRRYHCPLSRTIFLGKPTKDFLNAEAAVQEGLSAGLEHARTGNQAQDIANAFFAVLKKYGIEKDSRTGYPIGISYPPDWGERTFSLRPGDETPLETNMTIHFMTGLWMENWGFEITESLVVTPAGPELLANVPRELVIID